eukprot:gene4363-4616_t
MEVSGEQTYQEALQNGKLAFGFSAGGLLFPYYLGVADQLQQLGVLQPDTRLSGASAGSLIAACLKSGLPLSTIQAACFELARDCRTKGTRHRLKFVLQDTLEQLLPADVAERCSGQVHVAVTRLTPGLRPQLVSHFRDREDLIAALLTSCHIPWYFDGNLITSFRKEPCFDGGITNFLPDVPNATTCRVCCLPSKQLGRIGNISISPDTYQDWPYSLNQMLGWAFEPADEEQLQMLIGCGRSDAQQWAHAAGLVPGSENNCIPVVTGADSDIRDAFSSTVRNGNNSNSSATSLELPLGGAAEEDIQQLQQQPPGRLAEVSSFFSQLVQRR